MPLSELQGWLQFDRHEPIGKWRDDWRAALVASVIANVNRSSKSSKTWQPKDFMPDWGAKPKQQTPQQMSAILMQMASVANAKFAKKG